MHWQFSLELLRNVYQHCFSQLVNWNPSCEVCPILFHLLWILFRIHPPRRIPSAFIRSTICQSSLHPTSQSWKLCNQLCSWSNTIYFPTENPGKPLPATVTWTKLTTTILNFSPAHPACSIFQNILALLQPHSVFQSTGISAVQPPDQSALIPQNCFPATNPSVLFPAALP